MALAKIDDLNGPAEEVTKWVGLAKQLSGMYDHFIEVDQEDEHYRAPGIHASELYPCLRRPVYNVLDTPKRPKVAKFWKQRFKVGSAIHLLVQNDFHRMAKRTQKKEALVAAEQFAEANNYEMQFEDELPVSPEHQPIARHYKLYSSCDGVFTFRDRETKEVVLRVGLEIKTESPDQYEKLKEPKFEHVRQTHVYMAALDLPLMWFFYMNKGNQNNTNSSAPYLIHFNSAIWNELEVRFRAILDHAERNELPPRTETVLCEFCPWSYTCQPNNIMKVFQNRDLASSARKNNIRAPRK